MSGNVESAETEVQRRRRLRQERIMDRGGDRLSRIKNTLSQVQEENSDSEIAIAGGHALKHAVDRSPSISEQSTIDLDKEASVSRPLRRVGNLARKAKLEAENDSGSIQSSDGDSVSGSVRERSRRRTQAAIQTADINSDALHDTVDAAIADPADDAPRFLPSEPSSSFSLDESAGTGGAVIAPRQFSAIGLSRAIARSVPIISIYLYGLRRENGHERLMGDREDDVHAKWAGLLNTRPDSRLDEWAGGSYLFWYAIVLEIILFAAYSALSSGRRRAPPSLVVGLIPGIPSWTSDVVAVGNRIVDSLSILLFLTALSILGTT
ncbi:hypothetical protein LPJ72_000602 [Coemansia sp. Benny D160-2]|nr:hypothetical protein LPJ72_000602 [Coemansia sp. Benny D160-2]